jgi:hypothetical protein
MLSAMDPPFRHLLLTRFNVMTEFAPAAQRLEDTWIDARLDMFRRYCVPSVESQTTKVTWVVFLDAGSPAWLKQEMARYPSLEALYLSGPGTPQAMAAAVKAAGLVDRPYLLTSRVDSDDALATTFVDTVQSAFHGQQREFIELPVGYQNYRGGLYTRVWRSNPFLSLVEKIGPDGGFSTVFCMSHAQVLRTQPTRTLWRPPQWLQTLHDANNESVLVGGVIPLVRSRAKHFVCQWEEPLDPLDRRAALALRIGTQRVVRKSRTVMRQVRGR